MSRAALLLALLISPWFAGQCSAQNQAQTVQLTPTIRLSNEETMRAKQVTRDLTNAQDRSKIAKARWDDFDEKFYQAHPELRGGGQFSSDFADVYLRLGDSVGAMAMRVELSADERRDAQARYNELKESDAAVKSAQQNWENFQNELLVKRVPGVVPKSSFPANQVFNGGVVSFDGKEYLIPSPWQSGILLTTDFGTAVPR